MTRRVIIFTPYILSDTTRAAIRIAELLQVLGARVQLVALSLAIDNVDPYWDSHVVKHRTLVQYSPEDLLVFMSQPDYSWIPWLAAVDLPYVILHNNNFPGLLCNSIYVCASRVICPDEATYKALTVAFSATSAKIIHIPWDIGGVRFRVPSLAKSPVMMLPLHDMHWQAVHPTYLDHLATLTVTHNTHLIIAASPRWPAPIRRAVRQLVRRLPQVSAILPNNEMQLRELAATTSLIVWPGNLDPFGTITQLGLYSGVPVITWRIGMAAELIRTSYNGVLVSQAQTTDADNNKQFLATARRIACTASQLSDMRSHTHDLLADRQRAFIQGWQEILEIRQ